MPDSPQRRGSAQGCLHAGKGAFLLISAFGVGLLGWLALNIMAENLRKSPDLAAQAPRLAVAVIHNRYWLFAAMLPPIACAAIMLRRQATAQVNWGLFMLSEAWLVILFALILYSVIGSLAPLYEYQAL